MKFITILSSFLYFINSNAFINKFYFKPLKITKRTIIYKPTILYDNNINNSICNNSICNNNIINNKINSYLKLIRYKNILPTFLLSFTGGWLINRSIIQLLQSPYFIISTINTILIMSASMVINDIYDIKVDRMNNLNRPLVTGEISIREALLFYFTLLGLTEFLNLNYLPSNLQNIIHLTIFFINIYTPILKKIPLIKNISCAFVVSFSLFFAALSSTNDYIVLNKNFGLLSIFLSLIFFGSLYNELLLDMRDYDGDKDNKIYTLPVLFGKNFSWIIANIILTLNIIINSLSLVYLFNFNVGFFLLFIFSTAKFELYNIKKYNYSKNVIIESIKSLSETFMLLVLYIFILSIL